MADHEVLDVMWFKLGSCECGCQQRIPIRTTRGIIQTFKHGHSPQRDRTGDKNSNWRGGIGRTVKGGYIAIRMPNHPNAQNSYVLEHRLVMERKLGRYLSSREHVHHINGNIQDNRIENLEVLSIDEHSRKHMIGNKISVGRIYSEQHRKRISESIKAYRARRRALGQ